MHCEVDYINKWLEERPHIVYFVAGMTRNGLIEDHYNAATTGTNAPANLGIKMFADGAMNWRMLTTTEKV